MRRTVERWLGRAVGGISPTLLGRVLPTRTVDGQRLSATHQLLVTMGRLTRSTDYSKMSVARARRVYRRACRQLAGPLHALPLVTDLTIGTQSGRELAARLYIADLSLPDGPVVLFLHGGGHTIGDLDTHDPLCRRIAKTQGWPVLAVDYRLAPETPFPGAFDDAVAAFDWLASPQCSAHGLADRPILIVGDSAGGNLGAALSLARPSAAAALLFYPLVDARMATGSYGLFGAGFGLDDAGIRWFRKHYLGDDPATRRDIRVSPILAPDLTNVCPTVVVTAGFDPLRDDGAIWVEALSHAGVVAEEQRCDSLIHGFVSFAGIDRASREAVERGLERLRELAAAPAQ